MAEAPANSLTVHTSIYQKTFSSSAPNSGGHEAGWKAGLT